MVYWHLLDQRHLVTGDHEASVVVLVGDVEVGLVLAQVADNVQPALCVARIIISRRYTCHRSVIKPQSKQASSIAFKNVLENLKTGCPQWC